MLFRSGHGVSLHVCTSKAQPLLLTLDEGYLLTAALPDLECGVAPLDPPAPTQPLLLGRGVAPVSLGTFKYNKYSLIGEFYISHQLLL